MKKLIFILTLATICVFKCMYVNANTGQNLQNLRLFEYSDYKNFTLENIKSLKIIRYTEAGISEKNIDDKVTINRIYNYLNKIKISNESKMSCTDNTTIYSFILKDNSKISIEIECDWIVIKGKNYNFKYSD
ncbi:hypothetical protein IJG72_04390 [bacterium]|nr:hypothetical protein [bacterium]